MSGLVIKTMNGSNILHGTRLLHVQLMRIFLPLLMPLIKPQTRRCRARSISSPNALLKHPGNLDIRSGPNGSLSSSQGQEYFVWKTTAGASSKLGC